MKKKISFLIAILIVFMVQLNYVSAYNNYNSDIGNSYSCGANAKGTYLLTGIPVIIVKVVHIAYMALMVAAPVILVIFGMIDLLKAVTSGKEDDIKKAQGTFIKRLIAGALVFFVFVGVKLLVNFAGADKGSSRVIKCADCFLNKKECKLNKG